MELGYQAERLLLITRGLHKRVVGRDAMVFASLGGQPVEVVASKLKAGDLLGLRYGAYGWPTSPASLPQLPDRRPYGSEKAVTLSTAMTVELAFLLGAYASEGHTTRSNWSVIVTNSVLDILQRVQEAWASCFGLTARITHQTDRCPGVVVSSKRLVEFLELLGCGSRASDKAIPDVVMASTREHVLAYLQGLALDGYTANTGAGKWAICLESSRLIDGMQELLTRLGIVNAQIKKFSRRTGKTYFELYAAGPWGQELCRLVPFLEPDKAARAAKRSHVYRRLNGGCHPRDVGARAVPADPARSERSQRSWQGTSAVLATLGPPDEAHLPSKRPKGPSASRCQTASLAGERTR